MFNFSIRKAFVYAFRFFGQNFVGVFALTILSVTIISLTQMAVDYFVISNLGTLLPVDAVGTVSNEEYYKPLFGVFVYSCVVLFINSLVFFMFTGALLPLCLGGELKLKKYFPPLNKIIKFFGGFITIILPFSFALLIFFVVTSAPVTQFFVENGLLSVLIIVPFLILVSGIIISALLFRYIFFYFSVFDGKTVSESFRKSTELTLGKRNKIFFLVILLLIINYFGRVLIIGSIITIPISVLVLIYVYFCLEGRKEPFENSSPAVIPQD